jgi:AraC-like DNA-binding protein
MKSKLAGVLVLLFLHHISYAQRSESDGSYDDLIAKIDLYQSTPKVWVYLNAYLEKARREKDGPEIVAAYKEILHECSEDLRIVYADSMVMASKQTGIPDLIGASYLSKGILYYQQKQHDQALDNYIAANKYLIHTKDEYLKHKLKYSIGQIKYYLGYYNEAISYFSECVDYYRDTDAVPYLNSLYCLGLGYTSIGELPKAETSYTLALEGCQKYNIKFLLPYIGMAQGINNYKRKNFLEAKKDLTYSLPPIRQDNDIANQAVANFYLGKVNWALGLRQQAIDNFILVDSAFVKHKYIRPDLRENYEFLIRYFHQRKMHDSELKYIDRLLRADSILNTQYKYLVKKIHKEYDTGELLAQKEQIEIDLQKSNGYGWIMMSIIILLIASLCIFFRRNYNLKRKYRQRFENLLNNEIDAKPIVNPPVHKLDINPVVVENIIKRMAEFENKKKFLQKDINAYKLAESIGTNYKYLSKVIRQHKDKSFVNYINDLRIDYIVERLKSEPRLRNYTNGALADESGFSTAQHFTTAFKKRARISPGYFMEELNNIIPEENE